ncbi:MAG: hypothetical protein BWY04_01412 [candidate division CPR1 bacterium ADurb.Bin160]|uniref:Uncharacterized protein n=1 Tax=candidate division CPR1 bacterium ADurb.Bin160 TaxID=1852826 RepID=A0A1V5ZJ94_9BACT|nr:MAG: hypothetical protein BWY04_01412 [candidate division CPR1 bacterium ADurb.Bin160]
METSIENFIWTGDNYIKLCEFFDINKVSVDDNKIALIMLNNKLVYLKPNAIVKKKIRVEYTVEENNVKEESCSK